MNKPDVFFKEIVPASKLSKIAYKAKKLNLELVEANEVHDSEITDERRKRLKSKAKSFYEVTLKYCS